MSRPRSPRRLEAPGLLAVTAAVSGSREATAGGERRRLPPTAARTRLGLLGFTGSLAPAATHTDTDTAHAGTDAQAETHSRTRTHKAPYAHWFTHVPSSRPSTLNPPYFPRPFPHPFISTLNPRPQTPASRTTAGPRSAKYEAPNPHPAPYSIFQRDYAAASSRRSRRPAAAAAAASASAAARSPCARASSSLGSRRASSAARRGSCGAGRASLPCRRPDALRRTHPCWRVATRQMLFADMREQGTGVSATNFRFHSANRTGVKFRWPYIEICSLPDGRISLHTKSAADVPYLANTFRLFGGRSQSSRQNSISDGKSPSQLSHRKCHKTQCSASMRAATVLQQTQGFHYLHARPYNICIFNEDVNCSFSSRMIPDVRLMTLIHLNSVKPDDDQHVVQ